MHRSRVGVVLIDRPRTSSARALAFWRAALGVPAGGEEAGTYADLGWLNGVEFAFQHLGDGEPRVHIDIESDDVRAEIDRLVGLGASISTDNDDYAIMTDPDGQIFCVVGVQTGPERFRAGAITWGGDTDGVDWWGWQRSWDRQQEAFLPDREERYGALLDTVEVVAGSAPRVLDLAGGTGSISIRLLDRFPDATAVLLDADPSLLRIAENTVGRDPRLRIVRADLREPGWSGDLGGPFDAVLSATALHWIKQDRVGDLYREVAEVVRPGGVFANADHMPDPDLPGLTERLERFAEQRRDAAYASGRAESWPDWWQRARESAELGDAVAERDTIFQRTHSDGWMPPHDQQLDLLRASGFSEAGLIWRGRLDAAFAALR